MKMIRKLLSVVLALAMLLSIAGMALAQTADGTYEGVAQGMGGDVKVSVTVSGGVITDVTVLSQNETVGISDPALKSIPAAIVEANSTEVVARRSRRKPSRPRFRMRWMAFRKKRQQKSSCRLIIST